MKNMLKWFTVFFIVIVLITGLKMTKFSLFRPPNMEHMADYKGSLGGASTFHPNEPGPERHPPFGPPSAGMEWAFALADLIDLLVYALVLLPLFYGAYLLGKRTLHLPKLNTATAPIHSFKSEERNATESHPISSTQQSDYLVLDNHMLDQLR